MKKVKYILSSACKQVAAKRHSAIIFAAVAVITSLTCVFCFSSDVASAKTITSQDSQKMILELSESFSIQSFNLEATSDFGNITENETVTPDSESDTEGQEEVRNETTAAETTIIAETAEEITVTDSIGGRTQIGYTFYELGLTQMSEIPVPEDIMFDENGIPLNYSRKLSGKSTTYLMGHTTATGTSVHPGVVAVNPKIIPYGSKMYIVANDGSGAIYGYSSAEDTGGFIYMQNGPLVDMYVWTYNDVYAWGNHPVDIYIF